MPLPSTYYTFSLPSLQHLSNHHLPTPHPFTQRFTYLIYKQHSAVAGGGMAVPWQRGHPPLTQLSAWRALVVVAAASCCRCGWGWLHASYSTHLPAFSCLPARPPFLLPPPLLTMPACRGCLLLPACSTVSALTCGVYQPPPPPLLSLLSTACLAVHAAATCLCFSALYLLPSCGTWCGTGILLTYLHTCTTTPVTWPGQTEQTDMVVCRHWT